MAKLTVDNLILKEGLQRLGPGPLDPARYTEFWGPSSGPSTQFGRPAPPKKTEAPFFRTSASAPSGTRTPNLLIKSQLLYQLS